MWYIPLPLIFIECYSFPPPTHHMHKLMRIKVQGLCTKELDGCVATRSSRLIGNLFKILALKHYENLPLEGPRRRYDDKFKILKCVCTFLFVV